MYELILLGLVADELVPFSTALVPFQFVVGDGGAVVLGGIPTEGEGVLGPVRELGWERLGRR